MKKLMFATALVASAAAFATNGTAINATSFEGYSGTSVISDKGDIGESGASGNYFCFTDGDADGSLIKTFGGDNLTAPITRPYYYQGDTQNEKYLELSTEGGILWRSINTIQGAANDYTLGDAANVAAAGTYLDTLVQFTPTEDGGAPTLDPADKLAIWLNVDGNGVTNLMVRAKYYYLEQGAPAAEATNYVLTAGSGTKEVVAGQWYRLTVKASPNVMNTDENGIIPVFEIYVDGVQMVATEPQFQDGETGFGTVVSGMASEEMATAIGNNAVFPSLAPMGNTGDTPTLQGVGFKGSGALDDIVWTTENPLQGSSGGDAEWIDDVTQVFVGADLDAAEKAKITEWASDNSIKVGEGQAEIAAAAYLLGLDELPDAIPELTITSIEEGATAWTLTVAATVTTSETTTDLPLPSTINGAITLTQAGTLAGLATATASTTGFTAAVNGTVTVTIDKDSDAAKFMKVGVGIAPAANSDN